MRLSFVLALDHQAREVWRYYRSSVAFWGPTHPATNRIRKNLRVMLQNYSKTSVRIDRPGYLLGHA